MNSASDRVILRYTSAIDKDTRAEILDSVTAILDSHGYYSRGAYDKSMGAWAVDVTSYDPTKLTPRPLPDDDVFDLIKQVAADRGISVQALLQNTGLVRRDVEG